MSSIRRLLTVAALALAFIAPAGLAEAKTLDAHSHARLVAKKKAAKKHSKSKHKKHHKKTKSTSKAHKKTSVTHHA